MWFLLWIIIIYFLKSRCSTFIYVFCNIHLVDNPEIRDGLNEVWDVELVSNIVYEHILTRECSTVITFDEYGVSAHPNHIATFRGVVKALDKLTRERDITSSSSSAAAAATAAAVDKIRPVVGYKLTSVSIFRKYISLLDIIFTVFASNKDTHYVINFTSILYVALSMYKHMSQLVWYRILFILFSRYTFINCYKSINKWLNKLSGIYETK